MSEREKEREIERNEEEEEEEEVCIYEVNFFNGIKYRKKLHFRSNKPSFLETVYIRVCAFFMKTNNEKTFSF